MFGFKKLYVILPLVVTNFNEFLDTQMNMWIFENVCFWDNSILLGDGMSSPEDFDIKFVNNIWDNNKKDVNYILQGNQQSIIVLLSGWRRIFLL